MNLFYYISDFMIPILIVYILVTGLAARIPVYDEFVKGAGAKVSACQVTLQLVATYKNFENFMRDLYKHEHFLDISKIEIIPYEKNKTILLINCKISLYAKKV